MKIKAINNIRYNGNLYKKGTIFEIENKFGEKLVQKKSAELISDEELERVETDEEITYESLEELTIPQLKEYAEKFNIEITETKKDAIIQQILEGLNEL
ncbi:hypothetical protein [Fusobacterium mortiferum]|uniref:Uncharacterized protein n=1 Tax=Fusobacterium mortiferum TaxID=850 RepID=A0A414PRA9_FUSMR|nr:hypothetical protein [Fusobacterium mortiferum]RHF71083.1 hypothetical protein DW663_09195 [Fusobacterium mortiferum]